ncbi:MAG: NADH-quinone oxidoreductase subunit NuoH [Planctomycetota bacterium]
MADLLDQFLTAQFFVSLHVIIIMIHVILVTVAYSTYAERKISAWIHDRIGPNRVGPIGLLQPLADGVKLMFKEDYAPRGVDKALFTLAPIAIIIPAMIGWAIIPWGGYWDLPTIPLPLGLGAIEGAEVLVAGVDINVGIIYLMAVASLGVYGVTLGGWSSNNKYSFFGGLRASAGMISYEIPMGLALLCVLLLAGTVSPMGIIDHQVQHGWMLFAQPLVCVLFYICVLAESNRAPFDNAEAEQELVGGYHTEYSSQRFALFFLAEYAHIVTGSAFFVLLFLGGFHFPFVSLTHVESTGLLAMLTKFGVFYAKTIAIIFLTMWVRWTIPRIRWDQVMKLAWNGLIPIGIVALIMTSVLHYFEMTSLPLTLIANLVLALCIVVAQRVLPRSDTNQRVPLAGSRFSPLPGTHPQPATHARKSAGKDSPTLAASR